MWLFLLVFWFLYSANEGNEIARKDVTFPRQTDPVKKGIKLLGVNISILIDNLEVSHAG